LAGTTALASLLLMAPGLLSFATAALTSHLPALLTLSSLMSRTASARMLLMPLLDNGNGAAAVSEGLPISALNSTSLTETSVTTAPPQVPQDAALLPKKSQDRYQFLTAPMSLIRNRIASAQTQPEVREIALALERIPAHHPPSSSVIIAAFASELTTVCQTSVASAVFQDLSLTLRFPELTAQPLDPD